MEDKPTFFFLHFQRTGSEISATRHGALLLDLCQQRTTKATGNDQWLHLQTLSLALALVPRLVIPAGILRIPVFSVPVHFFSQESRFLFRRNFIGTP